MSLLHKTKKHKCPSEKVSTAAHAMNADAADALRISGCAVVLGGHVQTFHETLCNCLMHGKRPRHSGKNFNWKSCENRAVAKLCVEKNRER